MSILLNTLFKGLSTTEITCAFAIGGGAVATAEKGCEDMEPDEVARIVRAAVAMLVEYGEVRSPGFSASIASDLRRSCH